jgi:hypothetical protein
MFGGNMQKKNVGKEITSKEYDEGFVDGYKIGMNTGFDFVMKYCQDYKNELTDCYRALKKKEKKK